MNKKVYLGLIVGTLLSFNGYGGGGGSSSGSNNTQTFKSLQGYVYDPEVQDARVKLVCGNDEYYMIGTTSSTGSFKIDNIPSSKNLNDCYLHSTGGKDGADNLDGLTFKAPLAIFDSNKDIYITPITTLISNDDILNNSNFSKEDINTSFKKIANFLEVTDISSLNKRPKGKSAKAAKKLTLLAMNKNSFNDLDLDKINDSSLDVYFQNDNSIKEEEKKNLEKHFKQLDTNNEEDIKLISIENKIYTLLKDAFKLTYRQSSIFEQYEANMSTLSKKILASLKLDNNEYKLPNRYIIRKALSDVNLSIEYDDKGEITDSLYKKITKDNSDFIEYLKDKTLDIKNISGLSIYDINTYEKVLGNDNTKRLEYYTFSNISHLALAIEIAKDSYDDAILNPAYKSIAKGYLSLGFYDEAFDFAKNNIFSYDVKSEALNDLAQELIKFKKNDLAKQALDLSYDTFKEYAKRIGNSNFDRNMIKIITNIFTLYHKAGLTAKRDEVLNYLIDDVFKRVSALRSFDDANYNFSLLIDDAVKNKDIDLFKYLVESNYKIIKNIPQNANPTDTLSFLFDVISLCGYANLTTQGDELIEIAKKVDLNKTQNKYKAKLLAYNVLKDPNTYLQSALDEFSKSSVNQQFLNDIKNNGLIFHLVMNNQNAKAIELLTENFLTKEYVEQNIGVSPIVYNDYNSFVGRTSQYIALFDESKRLKFSYDLFKDSQNTKKLAWNLKTASDKLNDLFYMQRTVSLGYPKTLKVFIEQNDEDKIKELLNYCIDLIDNKFGDNSDSQKASAYVQIRKVLQETNYFSKLEENLQKHINDHIKNFANNLTLDHNNKNSLHLDIKDANEILAALVSMKENNLAKTVLNNLRTGFGNTPNANIDNIQPFEDFLHKTLTSKLPENKDIFVQTLLHGFVVVQDFEGAKSLIKSIENKLDLMIENIDRDIYYRYVARAYGKINDKDSALNVIKKIKIIKENNQALLQVNENISSFDVFPYTNVASVDFDRDGKPDFFNHFASKEDIQKSLLVLDDDIDNDDIKDIEDKLPYKKQ